MTVKSDSAEEKVLQMKSLSLILSLLMLASLQVGIACAEEESCFYCGMFRSKFGHSWVMITHEDTSSEGVCSIHCAAIDMALHTDKPIRNITVGDFDTEKQIDANEAYWVIGGDIMGVMTVRAKWAFEIKVRADNFIKTHGGRPANLREVIEAAFEDMYLDTYMIRKNRKLIKMRKHQTQ